MKLKKMLWTYDPYKDGSCDIKFYTYHNKKQKILSIGYAVLPEQWDDLQSEAGM
ncbi:hypothetical protein [Flavilitoribacter nigricans]|uniref:hypothetical protein n=1 Tax=Flavilitoribacter nigricans TaxID=70997 RepID=UPI0014738949|nr:hypothetical protein [Flavilitoribacter nigricans]